MNNATIPRGKLHRRLLAQRLTSIPGSSFVFLGGCLLQQRTENGLGRRAAGESFKSKGR